MSNKTHDILTPENWKGSENADQKYKTIEHIIPQSEKNILKNVHVLGNLTFLPQQQNSSFSDCNWEKKRKKIKEICNEFSKQNLPYLPLLEELQDVENFNQEKVDERSKFLGDIIWKTLTGPDWLDWQ